MRFVSVRLGNAIGQDIWELASICWGVVVEKLMMMWGAGEDDEMTVKKMMRKKNLLMRRWTIIKMEMRSEKMNDT